MITIFFMKIKQVFIKVCYKVESRMCVACWSPSVTSCIFEWHQVNVFFHMFCLPTHLYDFNYLYMFHLMEERCSHAENRDHASFYQPKII